MDATDRDEVALPGPRWVVRGAARAGLVRGGATATSLEATRESR